MFDGLSAKQKTHLGQALSIERFEANARVVTEGEAVSAIYFVKKGTLNCYVGAASSKENTHTNVRWSRQFSCSGNLCSTVVHADNHLLPFSQPCQRST
eukprot:5718227-Amphidinium_carterae.1